MNNVFLALSISIVASGFLIAICLGIAYKFKFGSKLIKAAYNEQDYCHILYLDKMTEKEEYEFLAPIKHNLNNKKEIK